MRGYPKGVREVLLKNVTLSSMSPKPDFSVFLTTFKSFLNGQYLLQFVRVKEFL